MALERRFQAPGPLALRLTIPAGSIDVETVEGDEATVVVDADDERALDAVRVELHPVGDGHELVVETEKRIGVFNLDISIAGFHLGDRLRFRVRVACPHGAALAVKTASADVRARGRYRSADIVSASGDVEAGDVDGEAAVKTASGDVRLGRAGGDVRVQTVSGDATVGAVGGSLTAQTVSGDIAAHEIEAGASAKTVSGDQRLDVAAGEVTTTSVSGDITVGIRRGSRVDVDASTVSGDLRSELALADVPSEGDGPTVVLRGKTVSGDFRVVRAS